MRVGNKLALTFLVTSTVNLLSVCLFLCPCSSRELIASEELDEEPKIHQRDGDMRLMLSLCQLQHTVFSFSCNPRLVMLISLTWSISRTKALPRGGGGGETTPI